MSYLGIDVKTSAVDLVLLEEEGNRAAWIRLKLTSKAFDSARMLRTLFPRRDWFEENDVLTIGIEDPFSDQIHAAKALGRITGACLALIPPEIEVKPVRTDDWRKELLGRARAPKDATARRVKQLWPDVRKSWEREFRRAEPHMQDMPTDPFDAYAIAYCVRAEIRRLSRREERHVLGAV